MMRPPGVRWCLGVTAAAVGGVLVAIVSWFVLLVTMTFPAPPLLLGLIVAGWVSGSLLGPAALGIALWCWFVYDQETLAPVTGRLFLAAQAALWTSLLTHGMYFCLLGAARLP